MAKSPKQVCRVCGMESIKGDKCTYCGQPVKVKVSHQVADFKNRNTRTTPSASTINEVHQHGTRSTMIVKTDSKIDPVAQKQASPLVTPTIKTQPAPRVFSQPQAKTQNPKKTNKGCYSIFSILLFFMTITVWLPMVSFVLQSFGREDGRVPELGAEGGLVLAIIAFLVGVFSNKGVIRTLMALPVLILTTLILIIKPIVAPVSYMYQNKWEPLSYSSETHLYFVASGMVLGIYTLLFMLKLFIRMVRSVFGSKK